MSSASRASRSVCAVKDVSCVSAEVGDAVEKALVVDGEGGDGGSELMGEVGQQSAAGGLDIVEPHSHGVERGREGVQLGSTPARTNSAGVVAARQLSCGVGEFVQGPPERPAHQ